MHVCDMPHSYVWHNSFMYASMQTNTQCVAVCCSVLQYVAVCCSVFQCGAACCRASFMHACMRTNQGKNATDSSRCGTWFIHMWDMTHLYVWHASFMCASMQANGEETNLFCLDMKKSYHTYKWFISHLWSFMSQTQMSHVTHVNVPCHKYDAAIQARGGDIEICPHIIFSNVTRTNESCYTDKWVISNIQIIIVTSRSNVMRTNVSCHTHECVISYRSMRDTLPEHILVNHMAHSSAAVCCSVI